jgi:hypothetical protein
MEYSRAGVKLIHEKKQKKSRDTVPLSPPLGQNCLMVPIFHVNSNSVPKTYYKVYSKLSTCLANSCSNSVFHASLAHLYFIEDLKCPG